MLKVFYGHRVVATDHVQPYGPDAGNIISPKRLEAFLDDVGRWTPVSVYDIAERGRDLVDSAEPHFALTFDDGYLDNLTTLLPIVESRDVPLTVFITTGFVSGELEPFEYVIVRLIEQRERLRLPAGESLDIRHQDEKARQYRSIWRSQARRSANDRVSFVRALSELNHDSDLSIERYLMTWQEVRDLDDHPLVTIAAHTHSHPFLSGRRPREVLAELDGSRDRLETQLGRKVDLLAYPYGKNDVVVRTIAARSGYVLGLTTEERAVTASDVDHRMAIPRYDLSGVSTP